MEPAGRRARGRKVEPHVRLHVVARDALSVGIDLPQAVLRFGLTVFCGTPQPLERLLVVLPDAPAVAVHEANLVLRRQLALHGGHAIPPRRLEIALRNTLALLV